MSFGPVQDFIAQDEEHLHKRHLQLDGEVRWFNLHKAAIDEPLAPGNSGLVLLVEDVTETRVLEDQLVHSERLASIGRLAAGVAHEIGNPVTGIACLAQNLRAVWEAVNNSWNQWVLNYTQSRQLDLLKSLGFESPSWQDLTMVLGILIIVAALGGMGWSLWERSQHDPWLRLLARARRKLAQAGIHAPPQAPPRALLQGVHASSLPPELRQQLTDWLLALERLRYAAAPGEGVRTGPSLATLQRDFQRLAWPRPQPSP